MIPMTTWESNMQPSGLYRIASTDCTPLLGYDKQKSKAVKIIFCIKTQGAYDEGQQLDARP